MPIFDFDDDEMIINPFENDLFEIFTKKRLELIKSIMESRPRSIRELSQIVERDVKNVFEDLKLLHESRIIEFINSGRCKQPVVKRKTIILQFSRGDYNE